MSTCLREHYSETVPANRTESSVLTLRKNAFLSSAKANRRHLLCQIKWVFCYYCCSAWQCCLWKHIERICNFGRSPLDLTNSDCWTPILTWRVTANSNSFNVLTNVNLSVSMYVTYYTALWTNQQQAEMLVRCHNSRFYECRRSPLRLLLVGVSLALQACKGKTY